MKLKLKTSSAAPDGAPTASPAAATPPQSATAPKIKLKLGGSSATPAPSAPAESQAGEVPKPKRKYTKKPKAEDGIATTPVLKITKPKKRAREDGEADDRGGKRKVKPTAKIQELLRSDDMDDDELMEAAPTVSVSSRLPAVRAGSKIKLKMKSQNGGPPKTTTAVIKLKGVQGKVPVRPPGVGYDSEAEEAEVDPAIESQFVLRMQPGPDCDLLRKAIEEKTVGKTAQEGGTTVHFRFFDREGRRALLTIQGRMYAACMVDLPCVVESMKSWNKKDWVKTADICQMLLVLGPVKSEDEAKRYPLPREVEPHKHLYPHGLTPPMHYVRKRRFRPRQSYHEIEQRESQVQALIEADENAKLSGGNTEYQIIDENRLDTSDESSSEEEEEDIAETTEYVVEGEGGEEDEVEIDNDDLAAAIAAEFGQEDEDVDVDGLFGEESIVEVETPVTAHDVAVHALGGDNQGPTATETAVSTPGNEATSPEDDDDDDDVESVVDDVVDAEAEAAAEGREQNMAELLELEQEITKVQELLDGTENVIMKVRHKRKVDQLKDDLKLKKAALGIGDDGD